MQIHELNTFVGTPSATDYLAIDDGTETNKVPATSLGVSTQMTQAEAEAGAVTDSRVITPKVLNNFVSDYVRDLFYPVGSYYETSNTSFNPNTAWGGTWASETILDDEIVEEGASGIWTYRKWASGMAECWGSQSGPWTASFTQQAGGVYSDSTWSARNITLPSGLFNSVDFADANISTSGYTSTQVSTLNTTSLTFRAWNSYAVSGMTLYSFVLHVKGTWKAYTAPTETYRWHRTA